MALLVLPAAWLSAQAPATTGTPRDVADLDAIIKAYYEVVSGPAGAVADRARDEWLHHPDALVAITGAGEDSKPFIRTMSLAE